MGIKTQTKAFPPPNYLQRKPANEPDRETPVLDLYAAATPTLSPSTIDESDGRNFHRDGVVGRANPPALDRGQAVGN
jgi:hypothetical protein